MSDHADLDERMFMISGQDENCDTELFMTLDRARADARYIVMVARLRNVRKNDAWERSAEQEEQK